MGDKALRGNKLTRGRGPHGHASQPHLSTHAKGGRIGLKHGTKPWGTGPKPGTHEFLEHTIHKRKSKAFGGPSHIGTAVKKFAKNIIKKRKLAEDTKKGKFPETESLTHQVGPYAGDVGSEGKRRKGFGPKARKGKGKSPGRPQDRRPWGRTSPGRPQAAEGGRIGKKHGFQILGGGVKGKPHSTYEGRNEAGRRKFKRLIGEDPSQRTKAFGQRARRMARRMGRAGRGKDFKTHGRDVPTMAAKGGRIGLKKGGNGKWMQKVSASIKKRGTKGKCTPITKPGCTGRAKALAKTFKKMAKKRKAA